MAKLAHIGTIATFLFGFLAGCNRSEIAASTPTNSPQSIPINAAAQAYPLENSTAIVDVENLRPMTSERDLRSTDLLTKILVVDHVSVIGISKPVSCAFSSENEDGFDFISGSQLNVEQVTQTQKSTKIRFLRDGRNFELTCNFSASDHGGSLTLGMMQQTLKGVFRIETISMDPNLSLVSTIVRGKDLGTDARIWATDHNGVMPTQYSQIAETVNDKLKFESLKYEESFEFFSPSFTNDLRYNLDNPPQNGDDVIAFRERAERANARAKLRNKYVRVYVMLDGSVRTIRSEADCARLEARSKDVTR